jgi:hypothetical protein
MTNERQRRLLLATDAVMPGNQDALWPVPDGRA